MTTNRVDTLIDRVMAEHPRHTTIASQLKYFEAVHQELAPLARALEAENVELRALLEKKLDLSNVAPFRGRAAEAKA